MFAFFCAWVATFPGDRPCSSRGPALPCACGWPGVEARAGTGNHVPSAFGFSGSAAA